MIKIAEYLFKKAARRKIECAGVVVNVNGKRGIGCSFRPSEAAEAAAKYSGVGLVLDRILAKEVSALQSDSQVCVSFESAGKSYEALYDGEKIDWTGAEPSDWMVLTPIVVYFLSTLISGDEAEEMKGYFSDLRASYEKGETNPEAALLFCDAFFYGYAMNNPQVDSMANSIKHELIQRGIDNGLFSPVPLLDGLASTVITNADDTEPSVEEVPDYVVKYSGWSEEQKENIPKASVLDTFVMTPTAVSIAKKIKYRMDKVLQRMEEGKTGVDAIGPDYINLLMVGRPATGKTALANAVAAMTQMPIYTVPFSKHTEEDTVEGKNKVVDGKIGFVETDFLKAYENGGIIVCEEINLADPGVVMGSMGQAIEKPFIVMKDGYIPVRRHPLCVIIATMNTGTAGSKQLNQALSSRFKCTYTLDDPDRTTFIDILAAQGYPKRNCRYIYEAYTKIINYLKDPHTSQEELCENITLRGCFGALENIEEGDSPKDAIINSLIGKIAEVDLEIAKQVRQAVVDPMPDLRFVGKE